MLQSMFCWSLDYCLHYPLELVVFLDHLATWSGAPCFMLETVLALLLGRHLHHSVTHAVYFIQCSCMFSVHLSCIHITFWSLSCLHFLVSVLCSLVIALCCITIITSCSLHVACSLLPLLCMHLHTAVVWILLDAIFMYSILWHVCGWTCMHHICTVH